MKTRIVIGLFLILMMGISAMPVRAYTEIALGNASTSAIVATGVSGKSTQLVIRPELRILQHQSGKYIILAIESNQLKAKIVSSSGVLETTQTISASFQSLAGIVDFDSDEALIAYGTGGGSTTQYINWCRLNVNSYTQTTYQNSYSVGGGGAQTNTKFAPIIKNTDTGYFYVWLYYHSYLNGGRYRIERFIGTTASTALGEQTETHNELMPEILGYYYSGAIYYIRDNIYSSNPIAYKFDTATNLLTTLATLPNTDRFPSVDATNNRVVHLGSGVYQSGTYYYLYHSWAFSYVETSIRKVRNVLWVGKFNNTITSGSLISQVEKTYVDVDSSSASETVAGVVQGWIHEGSTPESLVLNVFYQDLVTGLYTFSIGHTIYTVDDIADMSSSYDSRVVDGTTSGQLYFTFKDTDCNVGKDWSKGFSYQELDATHSYLYIGEYVAFYNYTETFAYAPTDNPLLTSKFYTFTWTIYKGGVIATNETYKLFINNVEYHTGNLVSGIASKQIQFGLTGDFILQIKLYSGSYLTFTGSTHTMTVSTSSASQNDVPDSAQISGYYVNMFYTWIPIAIIIGLPTLTATILLAHFAGGVGALVGALVGLFIGIIGGIEFNIVSAYTLYLYVLILAIGIVTMFFLGRSGGNSGGV